MAAGQMTGRALNINERQSLGGLQEETKMHQGLVGNDREPDSPLCSHPSHNCSQTLIYHALNAPPSA